MEYRAVEIDGFADCSAILRTGVYVLVHAGKIIYVGKAKCGLSRIAAHRHNRGKKLPAWAGTLPKGILFDEIHFQPCAPDKLDALEREIIDRYRPRLNVKLKPPTGTPHGTAFPLRIGNETIMIGAPIYAPPPSDFQRRVLT